VADFETITYEVEGAVAWITLNRPEVHNSFDPRMQQELRSVWRWLRRDDDIHAVVLTAAGDRAFCAGIDRTSVLGAGKEANDAAARHDGPGPDPDAGVEPVHTGAGTTPYMFDDPSEWIGPKTNDMWKPVIAAVNGLAAGGAFYMLGEVDIVIASDNATFFDPHLTYGMVAVYEPLQLLHKMPFGELVRMTLLGNAERLTAQRAHEIGLVSEVCPLPELHDRAKWVADTIADASPVAVQGTLRALWAGRELSRAQSLGLGWAFVALGNEQAEVASGQQAFSQGAGRIAPRLR
jgi:enoyl-CoA hydratase/carnithine racemase